MKAPVLKRLPIVAVCALFGRTVAANLSVLAACALLGATIAAKAATITETYNFTASGFPNGSPVNPWTGSFTITFDPTVASSGALDAFSSNLPASYGTFTYDNGPSLLGLGIGDNGPPFSIMGGIDAAFISFFITASADLTFAGAGISSISPPIDFDATTGTVTSSATPLPATLPLFATGVGALGLLGWRRKRKARASLLGAA